MQNQNRIKNLKLIKRNFSIEEIKEVLKLNKIISIIGSRRSGKTFLTFQIIKELIDLKIIDINQVVYLDFSGYIEKNIDLEAILNSYFSLFPNKTPFFVFDEIQELHNFPEKLIGLLNKGYKIIITGSNAHLLSKELSTILRGKVYSKELLPLDFKEFLNFKGIDFNKNESYISKYNNYFIEYLHWGGFPEIVITEMEFVKESILKSYLDVMLYKDVIDRYSINNDFSLSYLIKKILIGISKELNINKIYNELKSMNIRIGKDSLYNFCNYLEDVYFIFPLNNYWAKLKGFKKNYVIDCSYLNLFNFDEDLGKRFENIVFFEFYKKYSDIYFLSKTGEIDFFIPSKNIFIQVVYFLNSENHAREISLLTKQKGVKKLIYFSIEENLKLNSDIEYISWDNLFL